MDIVKLDKLVKTLRRDIAANPMKAGVLGILLLGGLYFWGPLVWKWVAKKGPADAAAAAVVPTATPAVGVQNAGVQGTGTEEKKETEFVWRQMRDRRESDPFARSANFRPEWNHIFQVAAAVAPAKPEVEIAEVKQVEVKPNELGLVLQGVAISPNMNRAVISGRVYREHDLITVKQTPSTDNKHEASLPDVKFRLVRVFRKLVEVERGGKTYKLWLAAEPETEKSLEVKQVRRPQEETPEQPLKELKELKEQKEPTDDKAVNPAKKEAAAVKE
jgi:hypothetical protein